MASSDPFDDDDDLFNDASTLALLEQQAIQSTQAQPKRQTKPYHHTVAQPKAGPSKPGPSKAGPSKPQPTIAGRKAPAPLNTEPGRSTGGFGWEHGGKRVAEGNLERHVAQVNDRQSYWQKSKENEEESLPPDMVMKDGGYGFDEGEVVDSHTLPPTTTLAQVDAKQKAAAEARRLAIEQASQAGPSMPKAQSFVHAPQPRPLPGSNRAWARSVSAGNHPISRPLSRGAAPSLAPIPSQSGSQTPPLPASQGSMARKAAFDLDEERRKREEMEAELASLRKQLAEQQRQARSDGKGKATAREPQPTGAQDMEEMQQKFKKLQGELWTAKGEAESIRRAQKDEQARHQAEAERLRSQIGDMEARMREREREAARQVENVKTQAVFANHAAHNSAMKTRAGSSSQRAAPTPIRNASPRGKGDESFFLRSSVKGKGKGISAPPAPRFQSLNNAFDATPSVSRVKRQKVGTILTGESPSPTRSPAKATQPVPSSPVIPNDVDMGDVFDPVIDQSAPAAEANEKQELLYHLFNYTPVSPFTLSFDLEFANQSALYRMLSYRTTSLPGKERFIEWEGPHIRACGALLAVCGRPSATSDEVAEQLSRSCAAIINNNFSLFLSACPVNGFDFIALINVLSLLASTAWRFPMFAPMFCATVPELAEQLREGLSCIYDQLGAFEDRACLAVSEPYARPENDYDSDDPRGITRWPEPSQKVKEPGPPPRDSRRRGWVGELTEATVSLCSAICMFAEDSGFWQYGRAIDLDLLILTFTATPYTSITIQGASLFWMACSFRGNFRSIMSASHGNMVLERACNLLINPPAEATDDEVTRLTIIILRALSMLTIASDDAILLVADRSMLVPALIIMLRRVSSKIWGVWPEPFDLEKTLEITTLATTLFHHLVFPHLGVQTTTMATASQRRKSGTDVEPDPSAEVEYPQGINLVNRMKDPVTRRDFIGLDHQFISALGLMGWSTPTEDVDGVGGFDLADVQDMSIDILEQLVEGPELDAVYELYPDDDDLQNVQAQNNSHADEEMAEDEVDEDEREAMDAVIVIDDSD